MKCVIGVGYLWGCFVAINLFALPVAAANLRPFQTSTEKLLSDAKQARLQSNFEQAERILAHVETLEGAESAPFLLERGLLERDMDRFDQALGTLRRSADLDPSSSARLDAAGILVARDRWPEAVVALKLTFEERGATLPVRSVLTDKRFAKLVPFGPYQDLLDDVRTEQSGLLGKLKYRLEKIEASARSLEQMIERLGQAVEAIALLLTHPLTALIGLLLMTFIFASGIQQMRFVPAPWTLFIALVFSSIGWHIAAVVLTAGTGSGFPTITYAALFILMPVFTGALIRFWNKRRGRKDEPELTVSSSQ